MQAKSARLKDKVAIITGAARGQGADEARRFVAEGARVVLTDLMPSGAQLADELGACALYVAHDVGDEAQWRGVVEAARSNFGRVDILVNNAGIFRPCPIEQTTVAEFDAHYRVNQLGVFLGIQAVIGAMKAAGGGSIINISSQAGMRGYPDVIAYGSTKWAVRGMTKIAARELASCGIRVNSVHPGIIATPMLDPLGTDGLAAVTATVPLGRIGTTTDVVELVTFLASDQSSYITGAELVVDGGIGL